MHISKLNLLFTKKFLSDITMYQIEMFDLKGNNYFTNEFDLYISQTQFVDVAENKNEIYIPIAIQEEIGFILRFKKVDQMNSSYTLKFATTLKNTLETSLDFVNDYSYGGKIDMLNDFLTELLLRDTSDLFNNLLERANLLHFDHSVTRRLVLVDITHFKKVVRNSSDKTEVQENLNTVHKILKNSIYSYSEYAAYLYDDKFVLFKKESNNFEQDLLGIREEIMEELALGSQFVVSRPCLTLESYRTEFKKMTELHENFARKNLNTPIFFVDDNQIELLLTSVSKNDQHFFISNSFPILTEISKSNHDLIETLIQFFKNNMDTKKTSESMYIHKNTVYYRIKKLSELVNSDLFQPYNCTFLFIQLCLFRNLNLQS